MADGTPYNLAEVFEIAAQIERNGATFYRAVAGRADSEETRKFLEQLAVEEDEHERTFTALGTSCVSSELSLESYDADGTVGQYLRALAGSYVFEDTESPADKVGQDASMPEVIDFAIGQEKEAIVFYLGIKDAVQEDSDRASLDFIIKEEQRHLARFLGMKSSG